MERRLRKEIEEKIRALEQKEQEFNQKKEFDKATHAKILRCFLEDYVVELKEL
jgi:hypothetical protein